MTQPSIFRPFIGVGRMFMRAAGTADQFVEVGNCSKVEFSIKDKKSDLKDFTKEGGGTYASIARIDSSMLSMVCHDLNTQNMTRALFGKSATSAIATVTDEVVTLEKGFLFPINAVAFSDVVVKNKDKTVTYELGKDYMLDEVGILATDSGGIDKANECCISYKKSKTLTIEALTTSAPVVEVLFRGTNESDGKRVRAVVHRLQLSPAKSLGLVGDKFADLPLDGEIMKDATKPAGKSQYFVIEMEE